MLQAGQTIDRYTVDAVLGQGGMAVVYRVKHLQLGSYHALKVLTLSTPGIKERMLQEGRVQAQLRHPNIVTVTDVIDVDGSPGLVMEYIDGPGMDSWLEGRTLDMKQAEGLFRSIVAGVAAAHDQGLVHRDLKPANVMLAHASGGGFVPKVCDFGLAKALAAVDSGLQATRSGVTMGTPAYMAPEQIRDAKNVDNRADVFSLGCILYELICGRPPFVGPDILSIFNAVASGSYPPPISLIPDLPARVQNAIQGALVVDRERRIPDCHVLLGVLDGEPFGYSFVGATIAPAGPTLTGSMLADADTEEVQAALGSAGGGLQQVRSEPAPRAPSSSDPGLDGSIAPKSQADGAALSVPPSGRRLWLLPVAVLPLAVAAVLSIAVAGGAMVMAKRWEANTRAAVEAHTGGEVSWDRASLRPRAVVLHHVTVLSSDGETFATAESVALRGGWKLPAMRFQPAAMHVDGLAVEARLARRGWILPQQTVELLRGGTEAPPLATTLTVTAGPTQVALSAPSGRLDATVEGFTANDLALSLGDDRLWAAKSFEITGIDARSADPVLAATRVAVDEDGALAVEGLDAWLRLREDGLLDAPPVLSEVVPDWLGGRDRGAGDEPWFAVHTGWWPRSPERLDVRSGTVHVLDRAHAMNMVQWDVDVDRIGIGPAGDGWMPLDIAGRVGPGVVTISGDARHDGLVRGRLSVRRIPLERVAPYLDHSLRHYGVDAATGVVSADIDFTMKADSFGARMEAEAEGVAFKRVKRPEGAPQPPRSSKTLLDTYKVQSSEQVLGSLADPAFEPVDAMLHALAEAVFRPAGGAVWPTRAVVEPAPHPAPTPRPVTRPKPEPASMARPRPRGSPHTEPATEPEPEPTAETDTEEEQNGATRELNKFGREVREALDDLKLPGKGRRRGDDD